MQITSWRKIRFAGWNLSLSSSLSLYKNAKTRYEDNSRILALFKISSAFQKYILIFMVLCPCIFINILNSWLKSSEENRGVCRSLVTQFCHPVRSHLSDEVCTWVALGKDYMELNISVWLFHISDLTRNAPLQTVTGLPCLGLQNCQPIWWLSNRLAKRRHCKNIVGCRAMISVPLWLRVCSW